MILTSRFVYVCATSLWSFDLKLLILKSLTFVKSRVLLFEFLDLRLLLIVFCRSHRTFMTKQLRDDKIFSSIVLVSSIITLIQSLFFSFALMSTWIFEQVWKIWMLKTFQICLSILFMIMQWSRVSTSFFNRFVHQARIHSKRSNLSKSSFASFFFVHDIYAHRRQLVRCSRDN